MRLKDETGEEKSVIRFSYTDDLTLLFRIRIAFRGDGEQLQSVQAQIEENIRNHILSLDRDPLVFNRIYGLCYADGVTRVLSVEISEDNGDTYVDIDADDPAHGYDYIAPANSQTLRFGGVQVGTEDTRW